MEYFQAIVLALVQGLTEFLPISSSAHLILFPRLLGWQDQGLAFDVAVHFGTLVAVVCYFHRDLADMLLQIKATRSSLAGSLLFKLAVATLPIVVAGLLLGDAVEAHLRSPVVIAVATGFFGVLLWLADRRPQKVTSEVDLSLAGVLFVGMAQVLAIIPGTSRSGITMTAARYLHLDRAAAARLSFLMAIPVIILATLWQLKKLLGATVVVEWGALVFGTVVSALAAYYTIRFFIDWVQSAGFLPFVIYRLVLGAWLLLIFW